MLTKLNTSQQTKTNTIDDISHIFDSTPIVIDICKVLRKYPMTYWQFENVVETVKCEIAAYSVINLPNYDKSDDIINSLANDIVKKLPSAIQKHLIR